MTIKELGAMDATAITDDLELRAHPAMTDGGDVDDDPSAEDDRHLASGGSDKTLCGLDRSGVSSVHPSKARKDDCPVCRENWRKLKTKAPAKHKPAGKQAEADTKSEPVPATDPTVMAVALAPEITSSKETLVRDPRDGEIKPKSAITFQERSWGTKPAPVPRSCSKCGTDSKPLDDEGLCGDCALFLVTPKGPVESSPIAPEPNLMKALQSLGVGVGPTEFDPPKPVAEMTKEEQEDECIRLRLLGQSHIKIETRMGWPKQHGNRAWRVCKKRGIK